MLEKDTTQRQLPSELVRAARKTSATARYYRAGYCDNTRCDVRDVLVMAKNHLESIGELQCPSCGRRLLPGAHSFGVRDVLVMAKNHLGSIGEPEVDPFAFLQQLRVIYGHKTPKRDVGVAQEVLRHYPHFLVLAKAWLASDLDALLPIAKATFGANVGSMRADLRAVKPRVTRTPVH